MKTQCANSVLMVRPSAFGHNPQTAVNNAFQQKGGDEAAIRRAALQEFNALARLLKENGVEVLVVEDTAQPQKPDAVFPNNWISFHSNGTVVLYPMFAPNRRLERDPRIMERVRERYRVKSILNLTEHEQEGRFLEGTGSLVLDRKDHLAYACLSERTDAALVDRFSRKMGYRAVPFHASDSEGRPIYHTNVMMSVGSDFAVVCLSCVRDEQERKALRDRLVRHGREVIEIDEAQMAAFAGNILQLRSGDDRSLIVMSSRAYASFRPEQLARLESHGTILHTPLATIEDHGGGSARCMIAEIFNPALF
jgi:hypothetical protein